MRTLDYYESPEHSMENLGFCKPFATRDETMWLIQFEGEAETLITPEATFQKHLGQITDETLEAFARRVNPYYNDYDGYDALHIARDCMVERGCCACPMRTMCEPMLEELDL